MRRFEHVYQESYRTKSWWRTLNKGLKKVNIGQDIYLFGRQKMVKNPDITKYGNFEKIWHMVIYGPERKEFHVWGDDVNDFMFGNDDYGNDGTVDRDGNKALESKVKIYILTHILDESKNWCFDLSKIPDNGYLKVIYENGTVINVDFNGVFEKGIIHKYISDNYFHPIFINPVGYRKN